MNQPYKTVRSKAEVVVGGVSPGKHPSVTVIYNTVGRGNVARRFVRQLAVPDASLFHRLEAGVVKGDEIEVVVTTDWYETGSVTVLENFKRLVPIVSNGSAGVVPNNSRQIDVPTVQGTKENASK